MLLHIMFQLFERVQQVARKYSHESYWQEDRAYCEGKASSETSGECYLRVQGISLQQQ